MPSWSVSSKASTASSVFSTSSYGYTEPQASPNYSKSFSKATARRRYMPQPFFNAVAEYQLINGGSEKSAIKAILRERDLDMTVEEAKAYFANEDINGVVSHNAYGHSGVDEYAQLIPNSRRLSSDGDTSSDDNSHSNSRSMSTVRRRAVPPPIHVAPRSPYGFDSSFAPSPSNASFISSTASSTLYSPSISSSRSGKGSSMMKGMFKFGSRK